MFADLFTDVGRRSVPPTHDSSRTGRNLGPERPAGCLHPRHTAGNWI